MIKLPQPHGAAVHKGEVLEYTESQLKQAVRDALNLAADTCESTLYVEGGGTVSVFGPKTGRPYVHWNAVAELMGVDLTAQEPKP